MLQNFIFHNELDTELATYKSLSKYIFKPDKENHGQIYISSSFKNPASIPNR